MQAIIAEVLMEKQLKEKSKLLTTKRKYTTTKMEYTQTFMGKGRERWYLHKNLYQGLKQRHHTKTIQATKLIRWASKLVLVPRIHSIVSQKWGIVDMLPEHIIVRPTAPRVFQIIVVPLIPVTGNRQTSP